MSFKAKWYLDKFRKKVKQGFQGYPVATIAFYGPTNTVASKAVASIVMADGEEPTLMERWFTQEGDARTDPTMTEAILNFVQAHRPKSIVMVDRIIGCPHEEGVDYPEGQHCPQCSYWIGRDRFTGELKP
jgi:hypothetical protein